MTTTANVCNGIQFNDSDIVNLDDYIPAGEGNTHNVRPWLLHDHGFTVAVVFADCLQDAIDEAVDGDKMERYEITDVDDTDYLDPITMDFIDSVSFLGNDGVPHDIETLGVVELTNPPMSFVALFNAAKD